MAGGSGRSGVHGERQMNAQSCFMQRLSLSQLRVSCGVRAELVPLLPGGFDGERAGMLGAARGHLPSPGPHQPHRVIHHPHGQDGLCRSEAGAASSSLHTRGRIRPGHILAELLPLPRRSPCQVTASFTPQTPTSLQPASCNRPPSAPGLSCCSRAQHRRPGGPQTPPRRRGPRGTAGAALLGCVQGGWDAGQGAWSIPAAPAPIPRDAAGCF